MNPLAGRRGKAYFLDCVGYLGIAAATVPFGLVARSAGWGQEQAVVFAMSAVPPILATVLAARRESGPAGATWGKRRFALRVRTADGGPVPFGRALLRNTLKIAIPWQLGHAVAIGAAFGGYDDGDPATIAATVLTYPVIGVMIAGVLVGQGRTYYDRIAGSTVSAVQPDRLPVSE
ncbi:RDD family protein [Occultella glacieicola]|uniref:RDD family protein n=1 Tax=Occultella glacieicola TaxID=2518684 RepID=A0ABY2E1J7_9MICO|nr:RDD family protein [Occultella glacieicola]TDE90047.1 RDD family protein [Occultella glacieicola]